jgi:hypothetical protein
VQCKIKKTAALIAAVFDSHELFCVLWQAVACPVVVIGSIQTEDISQAQGNAVFVAGLRRSLG